LALMLKRISLSCENCHRSFDTYPSRAKLRFCSRKCSYEFMRGEHHRFWKGGLPKRKCEICGKIYQARGRRCCSIKCAAIWRGQFQRRANNPNWKGGKTIVGGYVNIIDPQKQVRKNGSRYVREHRFIMEQRLGRKLWPWELVHHKNGIKDDNRIENLVIVTHTTHDGEILCPHCHHVFRLH
jgi:hypothetical protein